ncbi:MAG: PKD domain-containing protein [Bacteroidia bacterium]|nr:PKD domain-containing protein [Bacteroidia bacterium]MDW8157633.1 PKD domain-containing protein [Bacteroidia bacterium]
MKKKYSYIRFIIFTLQFLYGSVLAQFDPEGYKKLNISKEEYARTLELTLKKRNSLLKPFSRPEQDCENAIPVCQQSYQQNISYSGEGRREDIGNNTCLSGGETNSVWYIFTVISSGTFGFTIETSVDYDFALYNLTNTTCNQLINQTPVRCNFSGENGQTGLNANDPQPGNISYNSSQPRFMPGLNVTQGQTYVLMVNNWSANAVGYRITFTGTSSIFDNVRPNILEVIPPACPTTTSKTITVRVSEPILCSTVDNQDFTITTPSGTVVPATVSCGTGSFSQALEVTFSSEITENGEYTLNFVGPIITDQCGNQMILKNVPFNITHRPQAAINSSRSTMCAEEATTISFNGSAGSAASYNWNFDNDATATPGGTQIGPHTVSWSTPGVKTIQLRVIENGCTSTVATQFVTVNRIPTSSFITTPNVCAGQNATVVFNGIALANATYNWNFDGGTASPGGNVLGPHLVSWMTPGTKIISLRVIENGCTSSTTTREVIVYGIPNPQLSISPNPICTNQTTTVTLEGVSPNATLIWNCDGCQGAPPSTIGPHTLAWNSSGVKNISILAIQNGCSSATVNRTVAVNLLPSSNFIASQTSICQNTTLRITFNGIAPQGSNFTWDCQNCNAPVGGLSGAGPHNISWSEAGTKIISLLVVANGCSSAVTTQTVVVNAIPTSIFSTDGNTICLNQSITFTYEGNASAQATYLWSFGDQAVPTQANTVGPHTVTWSQPGTYNTSLQVIENGCSSRITTLPITVHRIPSSSFVTSLNTICINQSIQINYTGGITNNATFLWNCDVCQQATSLTTAGPFTINWVSSGTKAITLQVKENNCDSPISTIWVTVNPLPSPPLVSPVGRCNPGVVTFTATMGTEAGTQILLYSRSQGGTPIATANNSPYLLPTPSITTTTTFFIEVVHNTNRCTSSRTQAIATILPNPAAPTADTVARCATGAVQFTIIPSALGDIVRLYLVSSGGTAIATVSSSPYILNSPIITTHTTFFLESENSITGCISPNRSTAVARIHPNPAAPTAQSVERCGAGRVTFTAIMATPVGTRIELYENSSGGNPIAISNSPPYTLTTPLLSTTSIFFIESLNANTGCRSNRTPVQATVHPIYPIPNIREDSLCTPGQITFKDNDGTTYPPNVYVQLLDRNNIVIAETNTPPYSLNTPFINTTTTYFLRTVDFSTGCTSTVRPIRAILNAVPPAPKIIAPNAVCRKENLIFNVSGSGPNVTYYFSGPTTANVPAPGPGPLFEIPLVDFSDSGTYTVVANRNNCISPPSTIHITVKEIPLTPNATFYNIFQQYKPLCEGQELNLAVLNYPAFEEGVGFLWIGPSNFHSFPHPFPGVPSVTKDHEGWYRVFAVARGCTSQAGSVYVPISKKPQRPIITHNTPICVGDSLIRLVASEVEEAAIYQWTGPANFNQQGRIVTRQAAISYSGIYTLTVISDSGCISDPATAHITVINPTYDIRPTYNPPVCEGQTLVLGLNTEYPGLHYLWSGPHGFQTTSTSSRVTIPNIQLNQAGLYHVVAYSQHCTSAPGAIKVDILPKPTFSILPNKTQFCEGEDLKVKIISPSPNYLFSWQGPNQLNLETGADSVVKRNLITLDSGNYSIVAIDRGCSSEVQSFAIEVKPRPLPPKVLINGNICIGNSLELIAYGTPGASYLWRGPQNFLATGDTVYRTLTSIAESGIYSVSAILNACTSAPTFVSIIIPTQPASPIITSNSPVCLGNVVSLSVRNIAPGATYIWNGPDGFVATGPTINRVITTTLQEGVYTVTTLIDGCRSNSATTRVSTYPLPQRPAVFSNAPICQRNNLILTALSTTGNVTYYWQGPNNFSTTTTSNSILIPNAALVNAGIYTVWAELNGCRSATSNISVAINPIPAAPIVRSIPPLCEGQTLRLIASVNNNNITVHWLGPNGFSSSGLLATKTNITALDAGIYTAVAIQSGCTSTSSSVFVNISPIPATPEVQSTTPVCVGTIATFSVKNPSPNTTYLWSGPNLFSATGIQVSRTIQSTQDQGMYSVVAIVNNCTSSSTITYLEVNQINTELLANSNAPLCEGQTLNLEANLIPEVTYQWFGPHGFSSTQRLPAIANVTTQHAGTYTLTAKLGACSFAPVEINITIWQKPEAPIITAQQTSYCAGQDIALAARVTANARFSWIGPDNFTSSSHSPIIPNATTAATGTYQVVAIGQGACTSNVASVFINVLNTPPAPIISLSGAACTGQALQLFASTIPGASYSWIGPAGFSSNSQNPILTNLQTNHSGFYEVTARVGNCSSATSRVQVNVNATPVARASANSPICEGQTLHLTGGVPQAGASYLWNGPLNYTTTLPNPSIESISTMQSGTYTLIAIAGACTSAPAMVNVVVNPSPQNISLRSNAPLCSGDDLTLTATPIPGATYNWSGPNGFNSTISNPIIYNIRTSQSGIYSLLVSIANCSSSILTLTVNVANRPAKPNASSNSPICYGQSLQLSASFVPAASYLWSGPAGFSSTLASPIIPAQYSGIYSVVTIANGCTSEVSTTNVIVTPSPINLSITQNAPVCSGQRLTLEATEYDGALYLWSGPHGFTATTRSITFEQVSSLQSGRYNVIARIGNCTSSIVSTLVQVLNSPAPPSIGNNSPVCPGGTLQLSASQMPNANYFWRGPNGFSSTQINPTITNISLNYEGEYSLTVIQNGCSSQVAKTTVTIHRFATDLIARNNGPLCTGNNLELGASSSSNRNITYLWQGPNQFISQSPNPIITNVTPTHAGTYTLVAISGNCTSQAILTQVEIFDNPILENVNANSPICAGQTLNLSASFIPQASYLWVGPNNFTSTQRQPQIPDISIDAAGEYSVVAIVGRCTSEIKKVGVTVLRSPGIITASILARMPICSGQNVQLMASSVLGAQYRWSGPNNFNTTLQNPVLTNITPNANGIYSVIAITNSCTSEVATVTLEVLPSPANLRPTYNGPLCAGQTLQLSATEIEGAEYQWSGPGRFNSRQQSPRIVNITTAQAGIYSVIAKLGECTSTVETVNVTVLPAPGNIVAWNNGPTCQGSTLSLQATSVAGATYFWTGPSGFASTSPNPTIIQASTSQTGIYTVVAQIGSCASLPATTLVTIKPSPTNIRATNNGPLCSGQTLSLNATWIPGAKYIWQGPNNYYAESPAPTIEQASTSNGGIYSVVAILEGCTSEVVTTNVQIVPPPSGLLSSGVQTICAGSTALLQFTLSGIGPWQIGLQYNDEPVNYLSLGQENEIGPRVYSYPVNRAGNYNFISLHDKTGCQGNATGQAVVQVQNCISCNTPTISDLEKLAGNTVRISWNYTGAVCYIVAYGPIFADPSTWLEQLVPGTLTSFTVNNLPSGQNYGFRVRGNCELCSRSTGRRSEWSAIQGVQINAKQAFAHTPTIECIVYPNPVKDKLYLTFLSSAPSISFKVKIYNLQGVLLLEQNQLNWETSESFSWDIQPLPAGVYLLEWVDENNHTQRIRFIKE